MDERERVIVTVKKIDGYGGFEPFEIGFAYAHRRYSCIICHGTIEAEEIHFFFDGSRYCLGCVEYE